MPGSIGMAGGNRGFYSDLLPVTSDQGDKEESKLLNI